MSIYEWAQREFEKQYDSKMTVWENKPVKEGAITKPKWVVVKGLENILCRISQKQINPVSEGERAGATYNTTLHCNPTLIIPIGSRIAITDAHNVERYYKQSSEGFSSYRSHQEIVLVREVIA